MRASGTSLRREFYGSVRTHQGYARCARRFAALTRPKRSRIIPHLSERRTDSFRLGFRGPDGEKSRVERHRHTSRSSRRYLGDMRNDVRTSALTATVFTPSFARCAALTRPAPSLTSATVANERPSRSLTKRFQHVAKSAARCDCSFSVLNLFDSRQLIPDQLWALSSELTDNAERRT
jgi:hypothetical protein